MTESHSLILPKVAAASNGKNFTGISLMWVFATWSISKQIGSAWTFYDLSPVIILQRLISGYRAIKNNCLCCLWFWLGWSSVLVFITVRLHRLTVLFLLMTVYTWEYINWNNQSLDNLSMYTNCIITTITKFLKTVLIFLFFYF